MGYGLNRLDEPVCMAGSKPMLTQFGIHQRLGSCVMCSILAFYQPQAKSYRDVGSSGSSGWDFCFFAMVSSFNLL